MKETRTHQQQSEPTSQTRQPYDLSVELKEKVAALNLAEPIQHVKEFGYGYLQDIAPKEFNQRLRETIIQLVQKEGLESDESSQFAGVNMLLHKDPIFEEVVLNPKLLTMVEILCGKGALLFQLVASVKRKEADVPVKGGIHADQNWTPAPFPVHNQLLTFCWACDEFTHEGGSTKVVPGSHLYRRQPTAAEAAEEAGIISTACPAGTAVFWDGSIWHGTGTRTIEGGERVVLHITFSRLALRPMECYDFLGEDWLEGKPFEMRVLLGREDNLNTVEGGYAHADKLPRTLDWVNN